MESKNELASYFENASVFILGILLLIFPLFMLTITTENFILPKQILLGGTTLLVLFLFGIKSVLQGQVIIRRTPFDIPVLLFTLAVFLSGIFSVNKADAFMAFVPFLFAVLLFFAIVNIARDKNSSLLLATSLLVGGAIVAVLEVLTFLKIYVLPFAFAKSQIFNPFGSLLDQTLYLLILLPLGLYLGLPALRRGKSHHQEGSGILDFDASQNKRSNPLAFVIVSAIIIVGLLASGYLLFKTPPLQGGLLMLPYATGFQTSFAAISQDANRVFQGFLFGSGYGTYLIDFTRFKQPAFNLDPNLWNLTFFRSSSFALELLATTGVAGIVIFLFLLFKIFKNRFIFSVMLISIITAFFLPFSFTLIALLFILLGVSSAIRGASSKAHSEGFSHLELQLVALQKGLISFDQTPSRRRNTALPAVVLAVIVIIIGVLGYFAGRYVLADTVFQQSLVAASQNNGALTYEKQARAISIFPYRDAYYRIFSQTNLAIANSLASQQPQGSSPSAQTQQTIVTLIQQSINAGRTSITQAPLTMLNWQNLSSVYRSLIGFGQNADQFAILSGRQAVALDPNNPQEYINLGGVYYQLGQWDEAIRNFTIATQLKPDLANAYYNLGHALQEKGDNNAALSQYERVKTLVANDKANLEKITKEIDDLKKKIEGTATAGPEPSEGQDQPLGVNQPDTQLPPQNPPVVIPPPSGSPTPSPKASPTPRR
jgi:tetratricopeptide (TPR) repeat protein